MSTAGCLAVKIAGPKLTLQCPPNCEATKNKPEQPATPADKPPALNDAVSDKDKPGAVSQAVPIPGSPPETQLVKDAARQGEKPVAEKPVMQKRAASPRKKAARKRHRRRH